MQIKNKVFEQLREFKGEGSWSDAVESVVEKAKSCSCPVKEQDGTEKIEKEQEEIEKE